MAADGNKRGRQGWLLTETKGAAGDMAATRHGSSQGWLLTRRKEGGQGWLLTETKGAAGGMAADEMQRGQAKDGCDMDYENE